MEALRQDDPRRFGPYTVVARFRETASAVQYLAHDAALDDTVVITAARPELAALPAFRRRFEAETRTADRLAGGWVQQQIVTRTAEHAAEDADGPADGQLWTAVAYVPALTLAEAIDSAGPLPERAVRILGAGIAETLSRVHATGAVLEGLAPRTVLLAEDGPRLTAFGPLGAAADAEARSGGQLSVRLGYLTPEQIEGKEAGPASDLFVLGLLLAYAATGTTPLADGPAAQAAERIARTEPELDAVPEELRGLIARCLAKDPADRPTAGTVAAELALEGAAGLAKGGWLPEPLTRTIMEQAGQVRKLAADPDDGPADAATGTPVDSPTHSLLGPLGHDSADAAPDGPADARPDTPATRDDDVRTTRIGSVGSPRAPEPDRPTTQLSIPRERSGPPAELPTGLPPVAPLVPRPLPAPTTPTAPASTAPTTTPTAPLPSPPPAGPVSAPAPAVPSLDRRTLLVGGVAGAAGLVVGGGAVLALGSGSSEDQDDAKPAPAPTRLTVAGLPPQPRWVYTHPDAEPAPLTAALWLDRLLVLTGDTQAVGIDLRSGRRVWECADGAKGQAALPAGEDLCFVAGPSEFLWLSAKNGQVTHRVAYEDGFKDAPYLTVSDIVGQSGPVIWFTGSHKVTVKAKKPKKGKKPGKDTQAVVSFLFAYDVVQRKEVWRTSVPTGRESAAPAYRLITVRPDDIVVRQKSATLTPGDVKAAKGKAVFRGFDRASGKLLWTRSFGKVGPDGAAVGDDKGLLYAAVGDDLQTFEMPGGKPEWTLNGPAGSVFGTPVPAGTLLHTTNRNQEVGAVDRATGKLHWRRSTEATPGGAAPAVTVSLSGKTLLAAGGAQVTAFAAADGRRLWKFQDIGVQDPKGATVTAPYRVLASGKTAVVQRERIFYAFPVA
ncbi:PQQ-binding-like beta-propeller repeat protein [Streptomyces sp. NBC_01318]|uniref:outer membrane protein assembly factor BamB family protein n=1 Tax=unclassified Streptomyces TaxID=2593676 RepID=UPI002DD9EF7C|nr:MULTISPECIES: PQQ-binding-like beta-propeller repeat protein [unclassified Streptomyces]WSC39235.1 PQQ-binding-like beta-propeller repeat protein [Streptomyces sp. NBC_01763]WSC53638.1 PQQ-binding-like beta-propeller repeat protein [Streptomyces sp. NBC_01761]WSJ51047.1 PQQ-binding-like beta-propeller repeat protein [Streptomyces sp. NBC_01318]